MSNVQDILWMKAVKIKHKLKQQQPHYEDREILLNTEHTDTHTLTFKIEIERTIVCTC